MQKRLALARFGASWHLSGGAMWLDTWGAWVQRKIRILRRGVAPLFMGFVGVIALAGAGLADSAFPFDEDLLLDAQPMKGSKRVPVIEIAAGGEATLDLWCNSVQGQAVVAGDTITIMTGPRTERACPPEQVKADEDLIDALQQVTGWRRTSRGVMLTGPRPLNFRLPTN